MGNETSGINKDALEKQWAQQAARQGLSPEDRNIWNELRYTFRPWVYHDKILIAWAYASGEPVIKDIFNVVNLDVSFQDGIWLKLVSKVHKSREVSVTHTPRPLPGLKVFAWVPFFVDARFVSADWDKPEAPRSLRVAACFKMAGRPDILSPGQDHLSELHVFRETFPQYRSTYF